MIKPKLKGQINLKKVSAQKLKNILAQPLPQYWPQIAVEDIVELKEIFSRINNNNSRQNVKQNLMIFGINFALRMIQSSNIPFILISANIRPRFVANQIIYMILAKRRDIPILCIPNLGEISEEYFGVPSLTIVGRKGKVPELEEWTKNKADNFPLPQLLLQYYANHSRNIDNSKSESDHLYNKRRKNSQKYSTNIQNSIDLGRLYLRKTSDTRVFVPKNAKESASVIENMQSFPDFISFSDNCEQKVSKMDVDEDDMDIEKEKAHLIEIIKKYTLKPVVVENEIKRKEKSEEAILKKSEKKPKEKLVNTNNNLTKSVNDIDFLFDAANQSTHKRLGGKKKKSSYKNDTPFKYVSLKLNKIQKNPQKIKKTKKNKIKKY